MRGNRAVRSMLCLLLLPASGCFRGAKVTQNRYRVVVARLMMFNNEDSKKSRNNSQHQQLNRVVRVLNNFISTAAQFGDIFGQTSVTRRRIPDDFIYRITDDSPPIGEFKINQSQLKKVITHVKAEHAILLDGPFNTFDTYMKTPVDQFSTIDDTLVTRLNENTFRFSVPLKKITGLDLFPILDVVVDTSAVKTEQILTIRSIGSTLYGNQSVALAASSSNFNRLSFIRVGRRAQIQSAARMTDGKPEYFEAAFDAKLKWSGNPNPNGLEKNAEFLTMTQKNSTNVDTCKLNCIVDVEVAVTFAPPLAGIIPKPILGGAMKLILSTVLSSLTPQLLSRLIGDYEKVKAGYNFD